MIEFEGIWFNMDKEIKRDTVLAKDSTEASEKLHKLYPDGNYPGPCLSVCAKKGFPPMTYMNGGGSL